ncbi:nucleoside deaminase [Haloactinomyces albus]|uniref:Guanine deaminase n=1 Tax=Haloactinomyces albus TaxID=1352928 RepID=A0AAE3ZFP3_9ACTN|nr:nucleoside deaminase [Haloactinomyces albus]MDR7303031.1 guanine deaminase [Haloactinomyces albus]
MSVDTHVATGQHENQWMGEVIRLATDSVATGGGPFGALVASGGEVVATGTNLVTSNFDPTAHAEVTAIRNACRTLGTFKLDGCVLVSSCEPCPMCMASALWARLDSIIYAADREDAAVAGFDDRAFYELFSDPDSVWPTSVRRVHADDRTAPFDAWQVKADRIEY